MGFNKGLFDFIGYMSFFDPVCTGQASDCPVHEDETEEDEWDALGDSRTDADGNPIDINQDQCNALLDALVKYAGIYESRQNSILSKLF